MQEIEAVTSRSVVVPGTWALYYRSCCTVLVAVCTLALVQCASDNEQSLLLNGAPVSIDALSGLASSSYDLDDLSSQGGIHTIYKNGETVIAHVVEVFGEVGSIRYVCEKKDAHHYIVERTTAAYNRSIYAGDVEVVTTRSDRFLVADGTVSSRGTDVPDGTADEILAIYRLVVATETASVDD